MEQLPACERDEWLERVGELKAAKNKLQSLLDDAKRNIEQLEDEVEALKHSLDAEDAADAELKRVVEWIKQLEVDHIRGGRYHTNLDLVEGLARLEHRR